MSYRKHYEYVTEYPTAEGMVPLKIRSTMKKTSKSILRRKSIQCGLTSDEKREAIRMGMIIDENDNAELDESVRLLKKCKKSAENWKPQQMKSVSEEVFGVDKPISLRDQKFLKKISQKYSKRLKPELEKSLAKQKYYHEKALSHYGDPKRLQLTDNQSDMLDNIFLKNNNKDLKRLNESSNTDTKLRLGKSKMVISLLKEFEDVAIIVPNKNRKSSIIRLFGLSETQAKRVIIVKRLKEKK